MYIVIRVHIGDKFTIDYYKDLVLENIREDKKNIVYMVDLSIQPYTDLQIFKNWLEELSVEFYWIDHHLSAIEATKHLNIPGLQSTKKSGCWLTWYYLNNISHTIEDITKTIAPVLLEKVSDFDTWNLKSKYSWQNELLPLTYYLESYGTDLNDNNSILVKLLNAGFNDNKIIVNYENLGKYIQIWITQQYKNNIRKMYECVWNDYKCLVVNSSFKGSKQFEVLDNLNQYDLLVAWSYNGEKFEYCLYTKNPKINCGMLCKMYLNGGGHPGAAGGNSIKFAFGNFKQKIK